MQQAELSRLAVQLGLDAVGAAPAEPYEETEVNRINDRELERSRAMPVDEVRAELHRARAEMLERFGALTELTADADEWFDESGPRHYAGHAPELRAWVRTSRP